MNEITMLLRYLSVNELLVIQMLKEKNPALSEHDFYELLKNDYPKIYEKLETMRGNLSNE